MLTESSSERESSDELFLEMLEEIYYNFYTLSFPTSLIPPFLEHMRLDKRATVQVNMDFRWLKSKNYAALLWLVLLQPMQFLAMAQIPK